MQDVLNFFSDIFSTEFWPARWRCGLWTGFHGWLYIVAELMIWAAYFAIPFLLFKLVTGRKDVPFPKIIWLFIAFILLCGSTHLMDALIFWWPAYRFSALLKFITGVVSLFTVYALYKIMPQLLHLRTAEDVETVSGQRRKAELQFSNVFNFSAVGMALVSAEGKWLKVNHAVLDFLGYTEAELLNLSFQQITHPDDLSDDEHNIERMLGGEIKSYQMEKRYIRKDGALSWALLTVSLVRNEDGSPDFFISQITDINNSKQLINTIDLMNKKDEFMTIAAHELKTPITSVRGALQIVENNLSRSADGSKTQPFIAIANRQIKKLTWIVNDLLDVTKIQAGKLLINISTFYLKSLIEEAIDQIHYEKKDRTVRLEGDFSQAIEGDKVRLEQVLVNLLTNAIKYSPNGGDILIKAEQIEDQVEISVVDQGIGIDAEKIPLLFQRFFRVENTSQNFSGLGMGLYISSEIIKAHHGDIGVESRLGEGARFWFRLPVKAKAGLPNVLLKN
ncbi:sensor histidine kinase [Desertivirga brevis]|uniref:sensor histidine kinase n=1 Tax=Desertivirga brevis TaxID=2810310 RepID=UPI001A973A2E|nr:HAMP domain-containing sensor histidine kinase [Pedobacter sp. SYSU D00873]